jgi:hypothetical protein
VFLIQLESWEAAIKSGFVSGIPEKKGQHIEVDKLLGWTDAFRRDQSNLARPRPNPVQPARLSAYPDRHGR